MRIFEHVLIHALATLLLVVGVSTKAGAQLPAPVLREAVPLADGAPTEPPPTPGDGNTVTFTENTGEFANPERGTYAKNAVNFFSSNSAKNVLATIYSQGQTLAYARLDMNTSSDGPTASQIANLRARLADLRGTGVKAVLRFRYPTGGNDATVSNMVKHIGELKDTLQTYGDVIAYIEAGFVGNFGEWHDSSSVREAQGSYNPEFEGCLDTPAIMNALLDAVPRSRMIALRSPRIKWCSAYATPVSSSNAYGETPIARLALHDDGILRDKYDGGTFWCGRYDVASGSPAMSEPDYWDRQSDYTFMAGEFDDVKGVCTQNDCKGLATQRLCTTNSDCSGNGTCDLSWSGCTKAKQHAAKYNWVALDSAVNTNGSVSWQAGYNVWKKLTNEGCASEIRKNLGYRYVLTTATFPDSVAVGGTFSLTVNLRNDGYARLYNPRTLYATLSSGSTRRNIVINQDPRRWAPNGAKTTFTASVKVPSDLPKGTYDLSLWLPDAATTLQSDPKAAIRFANNGTWSSSTGLNKLGTIVVN